jgi:hypothetical protein
VITPTQTLPHQGGGLLLELGRYWTACKGSLEAVSLKELGLMDLLDENT